MVMADNNTSFIPVVPNPTTKLWGGGGLGGGALGLKYILYFVVTGTINPGSYTIPSQIIAKGCLSSSATTDTQDICGNISIPNIPFTANFATCTIQPASKSQTVTLPQVQLSQFSGIGSTAPPSAGFTIGIDCQAKITLKATMTDATSPANTGNALTLAAGSTASGVGVQVFYNAASTPLSFGPDSPVAGNTNQWLVGGSSTAAATSYTLPFVAKYVQTASPIKPGSVSALATITFSYQ